MVKKQQETIARTVAGAKARRTASFERTRAMAAHGIGTADLMGKQISNIFTDYVEGSEQPDPRILLSAIGKMANLQSLKLRALTLAAGKKPVGSFFLTA